MRVWEGHTVLNLRAGEDAGWVVAIVIGFTTFVVSSIFVKGGSFAKYVWLSFSSREQRRDHLLHVPNPLLWWIFGVRSRLRRHESDRLISLDRLVSGISNN